MKNGGRSKEMVLKRLLIELVAADKGQSPGDGDGMKWAVEK
ncbi:hypothetical protein [Aeromonas veronii]